MKIFFLCEEFAEFFTRKIDDNPFLYRKSPFIYLVLKMLSGLFRDISYESLMVTGYHFFVIFFKINA